MQTRYNTRKNEQYLQQMANRQHNASFTPQQPSQPSHPSQPSPSPSPSQSQSQMPSINNTKQSRRKKHR